MANPLYDHLFAPHVRSGEVFIQPDISYGSFLELAAKLANAMSSLGLAKGQRVAVQVEKSPEALALYAACVQSGLVFLPLNTAYTEAEITYFLEDSTASLLVCDEERETPLKSIVQDLNCHVRTLNADGYGTLRQLAEFQSSDFKTVDRDEDDIAALLYTSGTTGRSKGAMLTHRNLLTNAQCLLEAWHFTNKDVLIHALPIFHTHGLFVAVHVALLSGCQVIMMPKFHVQGLIEALPRATALMGVPTFYVRLLKEADFTASLLKGMRLFVSGSAPLLVDIHKQFEARTGHKILERYGMTETNMNCSNPYAGKRKAGTVGLPLPGVEVRICDTRSGEILSDGTIGVLHVRGANVFKGYWNMPEKTAEELQTDGWFITGDLAEIDEDGYVSIVGRDKDLIISGGYNIYPKELETLLDEQEGVLESAVVGANDPDFGEAPVAFLVPDPLLGPDLSAIETTLKNRLARFKQPKRMIVVAALPRNTMGKVQKNVLRDRANENLRI